MKNFSLSVALFLGWMVCAHGADPQLTAVMAKLDAIVLPQVELETAPLRDICDQLTTQAAQRDPAPQTAPIQIVLVDNVPPDLQAKLTGKDLTLAAALNDLCRQCDLRWTIENGHILFHPREDLSMPFEIFWSRTTVKVGREMVEP